MTKLLILHSFLIIVLTATHSQAQIEKFQYWEIKPSEPRIRWSPTHNPNMIADWQIRYALGQDSVSIGGVTLSSKIRAWLSAPKRNNCLILRSGLLYDSSEAELCNLPEGQESEMVTKLNGEVVSNTGTILLSSDTPITAEFYLMDSKKILRIRLQKPKIDIVDISIEKNQWTAILQNKNKPFSDLKLFDYTFPYKERLFKAQIDSGKEELVLRGFLGMRYTMLLEPPDAEQRKLFSIRPRFKTKRDLITYSDKLKLDVYVPGDNNRYKVEKWETATLEKGKWTESVRPYGESQISYHTLRMPNLEASMRLSVVRPGTENLLIPNGEIAVLGFHENFISDEFDHYATHRFGWRFRTFNALGSVDPLYDLKLMQGEFRILFNQAVWNIEETFGVLGAMYQFNYSNTSVTAPGIGVFWGRAMPNIFDSLLRWIPWFKYPKYTDLDFTYIPPHHPNASPSLVMNFHGKMFFPNNLFFEGGVGYYQFSTFNSGLRRTTTLQSFVGTVGLGYMF